MPFEDSTRLKYVPIQPLVRPTGGGITAIELPKAGILSHILLPISINLTSGGLSNLNAFGLASVIRRVRLEVNGGITIFDVSGAGYNWLLRDMLFEHMEHTSYNAARSAVATGTNILDMIIPVAMNNRDQYGLFMLQNEGTIVRLIIDWEVDANIATGITALTGTASPTLALFEVPSDRKNWPDLSVIHQCQEDTFALSVTGDNDYNPPRGATLAGLYHLVTGTTVNSWELRVQQSNIIERLTPAAMRGRYNITAMGRDMNLAGGALTGFNNRAFFDFTGSDGLGDYGAVRDYLNTDQLTSIFTRINTAGAGTLTTIRRQLVPLAGAAA